MSENYKFDTLSLHAGHIPDKETGSRAVPIYQTTSYVFKSTEEAASLYNMEVGGHLYTRISNPTVAALEQRLAALEGGASALACSSGMAAMHLVVTAICSSGDHIVASSKMYGANINLLQHTMPRFGINTDFVNPNDPEALRENIIAQMIPMQKYSTNEDVANLALFLGSDESANCSGAVFLSDGGFTAA